VPVLLKTEVLNPTAAAGVVRPQMEAAIREFVGGADLVNLTAPYAHRPGR